MNTGFVARAMDIAPEFLTLAHGRCLGLPAAPISTIHCLEGALWITQEGDRLDYVVLAGQKYVPHTGGRIVVEGLEPRNRLELLDTGERQFAIA